MEKIKRHLAIKQILNNQVIKTQFDLASALRKEGFKTTQATLSRDMKELGIALVRTHEGTKYALNPEQEEERLTSIINMEIDGILANETNVIVKTLPGRAQGVAEVIDRLELSSVLGTLAGDNTVLVIPTSIKKIKDTIKELERVLTKTK